MCINEERWLKHSSFNYLPVEVCRRHRVTSVRWGPVCGELVLVPRARLKPQNIILKDLWEKYILKFSCEVISSVIYIQILSGKPDLISVQKKTVSKDALMKSVFGQNTPLVHTDEYNGSSGLYRIRRGVIGGNAGKNHSSGTFWLGWPEKQQQSHPDSV